MSKHPEEFTVKAWSANAIAFIEDQGLTREFSDWCGGWPCPVDPKMVTAAPVLLELLEKAALFVGWAYTRQQVVAGVHAEELIDAIDAAVANARGEA